MNERRNVTLEAVRQRVAGIAVLAGDDESAHTEEDALYRDVLRIVAASDSPLAEIAAEALKTQHIEFARWCA